MSSPELPNLLGPWSFYFSSWQSHTFRDSGHTLDSSLFPHPFIHIWPIDKSPGSSLVSPITSAAPTLIQQEFFVLLIRMATQLVSLLPFFTGERQLHQRDPSQSQKKSSFCLRLSSNPFYSDYKPKPCRVGPPVISLPTALSLALSSPATPIPSSSLERLGLHTGRSLYFICSSPKTGANSLSQLLLIFCSNAPLNKGSMP